MSSYEDDHPVTAEPAAAPGLSLEEILEELEAGSDMVLVDESGRRLMGEGVVEMLAAALGSRNRASPDFITSLRSVSEKEVALDIDESCPICSSSFRAILDEEEYALALDSPATAVEGLGVVRLPCRHLFCRKDASKWLSKSNSCPMCRTACDPAVASSAPASNNPAPPALNPFSNLGEGGRAPIDMMQLLRETFGVGAGDDGPGERQASSRDDYSSMYS